MKEGYNQDTSTFTPLDPLKEVGNALDLMGILSAANTIGMSEESFLPILLSVGPELLARAQQLPASGFTHHVSSGGLTVHGIEVGLLALAKLNNSKLLPGNDCTSAEKHAAFAWQAFAFALGALHDIPRVGRSLHVVGNSSRSKLEHRFDVAKYGELYKWIREKDIDSFYLEISKFFGLSFVPDEASDLATELLRRRGFLLNRSIEKQISKKSSRTRRAIIEFVAEADLVSVEKDRSENPELKRKMHESTMSLFEYRVAFPTAFQKSPRRQSPEQIFDDFTENFCKNPPMVDGLYEIYEWSKKGGLLKKRSRA